MQKASSLLFCLFFSRDHGLYRTQVRLRSRARAFCTHFAVPKIQPQKLAFLICGEAATSFDLRSTSFAQANIICGTRRIIISIKVNTHFAVPKIQLAKVGFFNLWRSHNLNHYNIQKCEIQSKFDKLVSLWYNTIAWEAHSPSSQIHLAEKNYGNYKEPNLIRGKGI
ncbi:MAG: hypothetical protein IJC80_07110 [Clostridia bacterium]|nr:hypothetical protein [Clostridia bacterium]